MDQDKCRVFAPAHDRAGPLKRKRGALKESPNTIQQHLSAYRELWDPIEQRLTTVLGQAHKTTIEELQIFIQRDANRYRGQNAIPTGLIVAGPSLTSRTAFFDQLQVDLQEDEKTAFIRLNSGSCPNLKALLKEVNRSSVGISVEDDANETRNETRLFDYDLEAVRLQYAKSSTEHLIVAFQDSEAFDISTLVQAVDIFHSWLDRIPFLLLFGIGTSTDTFQERLPAVTLRILKGEKFEIRDSAETLQELFIATVEGEHVQLRLGPDLASRMLRNQQDHVQSLGTFCDAVKYAYMSHFYANSASIVLGGAKYKDLPKSTFEAILNLPSYRKWAEHELDCSRSSGVRRSLESDSFLYDLVKQHLDSSNTAIARIVSATAVIQAIRQCNIHAPQISRSELYIRAMTAELNESPLLREAMMFFRRASSDVLEELLKALLDLGTDCPIDGTKYMTKLHNLSVQNPDRAGPLRSQHSETLRTTIVSQKVQLSKHKASLTTTDTAYSEILESITNEISTYFTDNLVDPRKLFLHEILVYDLKSPHSDVFQPRPRFVLERALYSPHDYLNCECCPSLHSKHNDDNTLAATQPVTSILYQLYLESGSLVNVSDLWSAYHAIVGADDEEENEETLSQHQALFQRGLAELRYLGIIKPTKKKTDHIAKATWKGL